MYKGTVMLCTGAGGVQGSALVTRLIEEGYGVKAIARSNEKCAQLIARGVDAKPGDLADLESLKAASNGADHIVFLPPLEGDEDKLRLYTSNAIDLARSLNIQNMVYKSGRAPDENTGVGSFDLKHTLEKQLLGSGVPCVCLRPTVYMENFAAPWSSADVNERSVLKYPIAADKEVAWNSMEDVVHFIVAALGQPELTGRVFDIGGPQSVSGVEIARQFSSALGRAISYEGISRDDFATRISAFIGEGPANGVRDYYSVVEAYPDAWRGVSDDIDLLNYKARDDFKSWVRRQMPDVFH